MESASVEEIRRQADLVGKEIDEALERTQYVCTGRGYQKSGRTYGGTMRLWFVVGAAIELTLFADSCLRPEV